MRRLGGMIFCGVSSATDSWFQSMLKVLSDFGLWRHFALWFGCRRIKLFRGATWFLHLLGLSELLRLPETGFRSNAECPCNTLSLRLGGVGMGDRPNPKPL